MVFFSVSETGPGMEHKIVMKIINRKKLKKDNFIFIYDTYGNKVIAEINLKILKNSMKNKTIEEIGLKSKYNIQLLVIKRKEHIISEILPTTVIEENDTVLVFGKIKDIKNAFIKEIEKREKIKINI